MVDKSELTSAFTDGEVTSGEVDHLLKELYSDSELRERWQRYHLIGDALRKNLPPTIHSDLSSRVSEQLKNEPTVLSPKPQVSVQAKPVAKGRFYAVAASVAMVGLVSFFMLGKQVEQTMPNQVAAVPAASMVSPQAVVASGAVLSTSAHVVMTADSDQPMVVDRLDRSHAKLQGYIIDHEYSSSSVMRRGLPPGVRVVTYTSSVGR